MAWPEPDARGVYSSSEAQLRRFENEGAWVAVATLQVAPDCWLLAVSWNIGPGGNRQKLEMGKGREFPTLLDALKRAQRVAGCICEGWRIWVRLSAEEGRFGGTCDALAEWCQGLTQGTQADLL